MATPNVGILTNSGKNLIDQVNAGQTKITFSKIVFSSMDNSQLTDDQIKALTAITPQEVVVNNPEVTLDNTTGETRIRATGNNKALSDGVYVKTYAVYAKDDSGNEILYGLTVSPNPNYLPEYDGVTPQVVTYSYKVNISNTSNITFSNSDDIYVSDTDLIEALQPYAKTVDVNQQLDKKVNVADMRKPASDVAGIEEVNAKQDKIGYTPADDSKVVHTTDAPSSIIRNYLTSGTDLNTITNPGIFPFNQCTFVNDINSATKWGAIVNNVLPNQVIMQEMLQGSSQIYGYRIYNGGSKTWSSWLIPADDSKVAHLSGANNFDTVPTVNNNPLLLASSLPSDLARTGSDQEFTGKNTFDTAPIDKTTGNPYITKDGVPSTLADTTKPANFTAGLQSGGVSVATRDDLKSVETSAWRQLDSSRISKSGSFDDVLFLYRIDKGNKKVYFSLIVLNSYDDTQHSLTFDLSNVISSITEMGSGNMVYYDFYLNRNATVAFSKSGAELLLNIPGNGASVMASGYQGDCWFGYDTLLI